MQTTEFSLDHPLGIRISRLLKEEDVAIFKEVKKRGMKTGYVWYDLPVSDLFDKRVFFSLCFYKGVMYALSVCLWDPELYGAGWDDHSEDKEKLRARNTEEWLNKIGFEVGTFEWGSIWAGYDPKGGSGSAYIRYKACSS